MAQQSHQVKIVMVGDGAVGKTCFLAAYTQGTFPMDYQPTVFENYIECGRNDNKDVIVHFVDTAGQEMYGRLRSLCYAEASVFVVCFSVVNKESYANVWSYWLPEIRGNCGDDKVPALLVGLKTDLLTSVGNNRAVTIVEARRMARSHGMYGYRECSAKTCQGCDDVVDTAIKAAFAPLATECCVML